MPTCREFRPVVPERSRVPECPHRNAHFLDDAISRLRISSDTLERRQTAERTQEYGTFKQIFS